MSRAVLGVLVIAIPIGLAARPSGEAQPPELKWYKGNTHVHSNASDGDSSPETVVRWYRDSHYNWPYNFLFLTDHAMVVPVDGLNATLGVPGSFLVMTGEEVTNQVDDKSTHVNGLGTYTAIGLLTAQTPLEMLQTSIDLIRFQGGVPQINHPNFQWGLSWLDLRGVTNPVLFEVYSGHPEANNEGGGWNVAPGLEEVWDTVLSSGVLMYGVAADDAHTFAEPWHPRASLPGRGWVVVRAAALEQSAILDALQRGDFYASTGVELTDYQVTPASMSVSVKQQDAFERYRIQFIGFGGAVLREALGSTATYNFTGAEYYVRAKVLNSNGKVAWLQPYYVPPMQP